MSELDQARAEASAHRSRIAELESLLDAKTAPAPAVDKDTAGRRPKG